MKDKQISIRLKEDKHARLTTLAWLEHSPSAAALVSKLVEDALAQNAGRITAAMALRSPESSTPQMTAQPAEEISATGISELARMTPPNIAVEVVNVPEGVAQEPAAAAESSTPQMIPEKKSPRENAEDRENLKFRKELPDCSMSTELAEARAAV